MYLCISTQGRTHLGTKTIADGPQLGHLLLLLQVLDAGLDDGVDGLGGVRVVAGRAARQELGEVEAGGVEVDGQGVAVHDVDDERQVARGGVLVRDQLGVLRQAEDVGQVEDGGVVGARLARLGHGQVAVVGADLDGLAAGGASVVASQYVSLFPVEANKALTHAGQRVRSILRGG